MLSHQNECKGTRWTYNKNICKKKIEKKRGKKNVEAREKCFINETSCVERRGVNRKMGLDGSPINSVMVATL